MRLFGRSLWWCFRLAVILAVGAATLVLGSLGVPPIVNRVASSTSSYGPDVALPPLGGTSILYDRYGTPIQSFNREIRDPIPLSKIPSTVIGSVLAVEDSTFYQHGPVDARSILRALRTNVKAGGAEQGGSTITQQVVKGALTGNQRTLQRKLTEARAATELEKQMTKNEILEYYLNLVYFGNNIYGVQAAAKTYWGVDAEQLDWAQGALLASLIRNPNGYEPIRHAEAAKAQRAIALGRLVTTGRLSAADAKKARSEPLPTTLTQSVPVLDYFAEEVRNRLENKTGAYDNTPEGKALGATPEERYDALYRGGLRIYTTYDPLMQQKAVDARQRTVPRIGPDGRVPKPDFVDKNGTVQTGQFATETITSVVPQTGAVRVLLGGPNFTDKDQKIIPTQYPQRPGSSFKTFILASMFDRGFVPDDTVDGSANESIRPDDPNFIDPARLAIGPAPYPLRNYGGEGGGVATITSQTMKSSNAAFVRLGQIDGLRNVLTMAQSLGLSNPMYKEYDPQDVHGGFWLNPYSPQQAIGSPAGVYSLDMAVAYAAIANDGVQNDAYFVDRIEDRSGHVIWAHDLSPKRVMSSQAARLVTQVLEANVQGGTGTGARLGAQPAAGKTGTTDKAVDLWFVGYTPQLATAVWIGDGGSAETPTFGTSATGGAYAARSWGAFMKAALSGEPVVPFVAAEPTRPGRALTLGPDNGMSFIARYGAKAAKAPPDPATSSTTLPPRDGSGNSSSTLPPRNGSGNNPSTLPPPSTAPPITSFVPRP